MEKLSPNRVQLFLRNKYTVFTMGGTVALQSVNNKKFGRAIVLQQVNFMTPHLKGTFWGENGHI